LLFTCLLSCLCHNFVRRLFGFLNNLVAAAYPEQSLLSYRTPESDEPACKKERRNEVPITRAIFIDSTWNQSRGIYKDQRLRGE